MTAPVTLWHYTCEHGYAGIGDRGQLWPAYALTNRIPPEWWPARLVWLTDLAAPDRAGLGLTSAVSACDRTAYRYRVTDDLDVIPWVRVRRQFPADVLEDLPGTRPRHWYVSSNPVPVILDMRP